MPRFLVLGLRGLVGAAINAGVLTVSSVVVDPHTHYDWRKVAAQAGVSALVGAVLWLKQHPLPEAPE
jgi:hypothetical protein